MSVYRIKKLRWAEEYGGRLTAHTAFGNYRLEKEPDNRWHLTYCFDEYYDEGEIPCKSLSDGKAKATEDWHKRLMPALEEAR